MLVQDLRGSCLFAMDQRFRAVTVKGCPFKEPLLPEYPAMTIRSAARKTRTFLKNPDTVDRLEENPVD
jgi:hypothetical protein